MNDQEFQYYEYLIRSGQTERYRKPSLDEKIWKNLMNDIITQIIEAKVPSTIDGWKQKGASTVPSQNQIKLLAMRLRSLVNNPELEEVSRQQLQWFKNIGNGFIVLENIQTKMIHAVMSGRKKEYEELHYQYNLTVHKLKVLLDDRDKWKISRKQLALIQRKNIAERKKKTDYMKSWYEYSRKKRNEVRKEERRKSNMRRGK